MAILNDDQKTAHEGRTALSVPAAPLRDQVVQKLFRKLDDLAIGEKVSDLWHKGMARKSEWLDRQKEYLKDWDEHLIQTTDGPWDGSSQLHMPLTFITAKALHARYMQALWQDPPFHCKANNEPSVERVGAVRDTLRWYLQRGANHGRGVGKEVDLYVWKWITQGSALSKWRWDTTYTKFIDVQLVKKPGPSRYIPSPEGQSIPQPTFVEVEEEIEVIRKCFDGPVYRVCAPEDIVIVGGAGDPDAADAVLEQDWLTASDLWSLADRKVFDADRVREIIEGGPNRQDGAIGSDIKQIQSDNAGVSGPDDSYELSRYQIIEAYLKVDVDGTGINTDVIAWVHLPTKKLLRATYLYRVSPSGERPYAKSDYHLREGQDWGVGIPELMYPLAKEADAIHNMRIDFGMVSVMPFGFYRPSSGINPETIKMEPGALIPVDNPQTDVFFPNLGNRTVFGFQEEQALDNLIQRLTGINEMAMGLMSAQGATRTATGARGLMQEVSANLDIHLRRLNWGWEKSLRYLLHLVQRRCPPGLSYRISGEDGQDYWRTVRNTKDLEGDYDIEVAPNSASSNPQIQQEQAMQILQAVEDPLAIQLGIVTPLQLFEAKRNHLQALGVRDWGRFLQKPQIMRLYTPEEEANAILAGVDIPINPQSDHEGFVAFVDMFIKDPELNGQMTPQQMAALQLHARKHAEMAQALKAIEAQKANAGQMRRNAAMSAEQTAPMSGPSAAASGGQIGAA